MLFFLSTSNARQTSDVLSDWKCAMDANIIHLKHIIIIIVILLISLSLQMTLTTALPNHPFFRLEFHPEPFELPPRIVQIQTSRLLIEMLTMILIRHPCDGWIRTTPFSIAISKSTSSKEHRTSGRCEFTPEENLFGKNATIRIRKNEKSWTTTGRRRSLQTVS